MNKKYIAIKLRGLKHQLWFEVEKTETQNYTFIGTGGWGKDGAYTDITVSENEIVGRIYSEDLQYD